MRKALRWRRGGAPSSCSGLGVVVGVLVLGSPGTIFSKKGTLLWVGYCP